ncbi:histidine kinase [Streptomyces sp. NPDC050617]|uniref:sensor histidine kinase n=1 Tax=Streptomyces sp. NPDC050617 TaxID=3154628 RepID=UPI0034455683
MLSADVRRWPWWAEALLIALVAEVSVQTAVVGEAGGDPLDPRVAGAAVASLSLLLRYRFPAIAVGVTTIAAAWLGEPLPLLIAVFHLASRGRIAVGAAAAAAALIGNRFLQDDALLWSVRSYGPAMTFGTALALGLWVSGRRRLVASLTARVEQLRVERELRAEQARLHERARIAAEMHDILAHRLSLIALYTGALRRRADDLPEPVAERIAQLRITSTQALDDLRDVLGALREPTEDERAGGGRAGGVRVGGVRAGDERARGVRAGSGGAARSPGLRELTELLDEARAAGQRIEADVRGSADGLPASHQLAVHRLVQESLTNARKHAPGAPVRVTVRYGPPLSTIEVDNGPGEGNGPGEDNGPGAATEGSAVASGYGLIGLAERVAALNGRLRYGPAGSGGWSTAAELPLEHDAAARPARDSR